MSDTECYDIIDCLLSVFYDNDIKNVYEYYSREEIMDALAIAKTRIMRSI